MSHSVDTQDAIASSVRKVLHTPHMEQPLHHVLLSTSVKRWSYDVVCGAQPIVAPEALRPQLVSKLDQYRRERRDAAFTLYDKYETVNPLVPSLKSSIYTNGEWSCALNLAPVLKMPPHPSGHDLPVVLPVGDMIYIAKTWFFQNADYLKLQEICRIVGTTAAPGPTTEGTRDLADEPADFPDVVGHDETDARDEPDDVTALPIRSYPLGILKHVPGSVMFENDAWVGIPRYLGWSLWGPQITFPEGPPQCIPDHPRAPWDFMARGALTQPLTFCGIMRSEPVDQYPIVHTVVAALRSTSRHAPGGFLVADCAIGKTVLMAAIWIALHSPEIETNNMRPASSSSSTSATTPTSAQFALPLRRTANDPVVAPVTTCKALVIVNKDELIRQTIRAIKTFVPDARIGILKACKPPDVDSMDVCVATIQSIASRLKTIQANSSIQRRLHTIVAGHAAGAVHMQPVDDDTDKSWLEQFGIVFFDEAHHFAANSFSTIVNQIPALYRVALTATPRREDGRVYMLRWLLGPNMVRASRPWNFFQSRYIAWHCGQQLERVRMVGGGGGRGGAMGGRGRRRGGAMGGRGGIAMPDKFAYMACIAEDIHRSTTIAQLLLDAHWQSREPNHESSVYHDLMTLPIRCGHDVVGYAHGVYGATMRILPPPEQWLCMAKYPSLESMFMDNMKLQRQHMGGMPSHGECTLHRHTQSRNSTTALSTVDTNTHDISNPHGVISAHPYVAQVRQFAMRLPPLCEEATAEITRKPSAATTTKAPVEAPPTTNFCDSAPAHHGPTLRWQSIDNIVDPHAHTVSRLSMTFSDSIQHLISLQHLTAWTIQQCLPDTMIIRTSVHQLSIVSLAHLHDGHRAHFAMYKSGQGMHALHGAATAAAAPTTTGPDFFDAWFMQYPHSGEGYHHSRHPHNQARHARDYKLSSAQKKARENAAADTRGESLAANRMYHAQFEWTTCYTPMAWAQPDIRDDVVDASSTNDASASHVSPHNASKSKKRKRNTTAASARKTRTVMGNDAAWDPRPPLPIICTLGLYVGTRKLPLDFLDAKQRHCSDQNVALSCDFVFTTHAMSSDGIDQPRASILVDAMASRRDNVQFKGRIERTLEGKPPPLTMQIVDMGIPFFENRARLHAKHDIAMCRQVEYYGVC